MMLSELDVRASPQQAALLEDLLEGAPSWGGQDDFQLGVLQEVGQG